MSGKQPTCATCLYWQRIVAGNVAASVAACNRYPPLVVEGARGDAAWSSDRWPMTLAGEWCGEWKEGVT